MALLSSVFCPFINAVAGLGPDVSDPGDRTVAEFNTSPFNNLSGQQVVQRGDAASRARAGYAWPPLPGAAPGARDARQFWAQSLVRYRRYYRNDIQALRDRIRTSQPSPGYLDGGEQREFFEGVLINVNAQVIGTDQNGAPLRGFGYVSTEFYDLAQTLERWGQSLVNAGLAGTRAGRRYDPRVTPAPSIANTPAPLTGGRQEAGRPPGNAAQANAPLVVPAARRQLLPSGVRKVKFCLRVDEGGRPVKRWHYGTAASGAATRYRDDTGVVVERVLAPNELVAPVAPALFFLSDGALPPAARDRDVMTRRDKDGQRGPATAAQVDAALARVQQLAAQPQPPAQRRRRGQPAAAADPASWHLYNLLTAAPEAHTGIKSVKAPPVPTLVPVPAHRRDELRYEMERWLGAHVTYVYREPIENGTLAGYEFYRYTGQIIGVFLARRQPSSFVANMPPNLIEVDDDGDPVGRRVMYRRKNASGLNRWKPYTVEARISEGVYRLRPLGVPPGGGAAEEEEEESDDDEEEGLRRELRARAPAPEDGWALDPANRVFHAHDDEWDAEPYGSWVFISEGQTVRDSDVSVYFTHKTVYLGPNGQQLTDVELVAGGHGTRFYLNKTHDAVAQPPAQSRVPAGSTVGAPPPWSEQRNIIDPWLALYPQAAPPGRGGGGGGSGGGGGGGRADGRPGRRASGGGGSGADGRRTSRRAAGGGASGGAAVPGRAPSNRRAARVGARRATAERPVTVRTALRVSPRASAPRRSSRGAAAPGRIARAAAAGGTARGAAAARRGSGGAARQAAGRGNAGRGGLRVPPFVSNAVASVFFDPSMYARVYDVVFNAVGGVKEVVLDFGPHYAELHGTSWRRFNARECLDAKITVLTDQRVTDRWNEVTGGRPFMETFNQMLAVRFADTKAFERRKWLTPNPATHFEAVYPGYGTRYADLWLHRCLLDRLPRERRGVVRLGRDMSAARIVGRIRRALRAARDVVPSQLLEVLAGRKAGRRRVAEVVEEDDDDEDQEVALENEHRGIYVGYPETWFVPWNKMRAATIKGAEWATWRSNVSMAVARYSAGTVTYDSSDNFADFKDDEFSGWTGPTDGLDRVFHSSLMNNVQLSSLYSTIGVRVHLRQAALALGVRNAPAGGAAFVNMRAEVGRTIYFAPLDVVRQDTYLRNPNRIEVQCARFCLADYDADLVSYAQHLEPTDLAAAAFSQKLAAEHTCELIAVELPVLNPYLMFSKGIGRRFFFQQTQADFVARLVPVGEENGPIVVGEYKTLMEANNPSARVDNTNNFRQVIAVARLFEAMTNLIVEYGVVIYYTRQNTAYVLTFKIPSGLGVNEAETEFNGKLFETSLLAPLDVGLRSLYTDSAHRAAFKVAGGADGFDRMHDDDDRTAAEIADVNDDPGAQQVAPPAVFPNRVPAPAAFPGYERVTFPDAPVGAPPGRGRARARDNASNLPLILVRAQRPQPADDPDEQNDDARAALPAAAAVPAAPAPAAPAPPAAAAPQAAPQAAAEAVAAPGDESDGDGGGGGFEEDDEGRDAAGALQMLQAAAPVPRERRRSERRANRQPVGAPFVGAGPVSFTMRARAPSGGPQGELFAAVRDRTEQMVDDLWPQAPNRAQRARGRAILDDVTAFFRYLKAFEFDPPGVVPPAGWDNRVVAEEDGRFGPMHVGGGRVPLSRMARLTPPADEYPTSDEDGHPLGRGDKQRQVLVVLARTLHRLVNERVQRQFILPHADQRRRNEPLNPANRLVTVRQTAEDFLHVSQRALWQPATLRWAIDVALPEEGQTLWAKVQAYE